MLTARPDAGPRAVRSKVAEVRVDHHLDQLPEVDARLPAELAPCLGCVAEQVIDFGRPKQRRIDLHVLLPVEADVRERDLDEFSHRMADAGGDDVVVGAVLLQHQPHGADVVAGKPPVAVRVEIAEPTARPAARA